MIQEQFGFGVNEVSYKGAGKMYEVLAQNAAGQAATARQDAGTAFGEYSRGMNDFNRYFAAGQNTAQAANATESRANQALNEGTDALNRIGKRTLQWNMQQAQDTVRVVNELIRSGNTFAASVKQSRLQEGMVDGMREAGELQLIQDPVERKNAIESFLTEYQENPNNAYNQGRSRSIFPLYGKAVEDVDVLRRETGIRSMLMMADNSYKNSGDSKTINMGEMVKFAKTNNLSMGEFRDALYSTFGQNAAKGLSQVEDPELLTGMLNEWREIQENNFNNEYFIKSKNEDTQHLIAETDKLIKTEVKRAKERIKLKGQTNWQQIMKDPNGFTAQDVEESLRYQQLNPLEYTAKETQWTEAYAQREVDDEFNNTFNLESPSQYWDHASKDAIKAAETRIGTEGATAFLYGNTDTLEGILNAHPEHTGEIGKTISKIFKNGTGVEKSMVYDKIMLTRETTGASQMLSQTLNDKELSDILLVGSLAKSMGGASQEEVEDNWRKATQLVSNKSGEPIIKLTPSRDRDLYEDMVKDSEGMGDNRGRFEQTIQLLYGKNSDVAIEMYDGIKEYYENLSETNEYSGKNEDFSVTENMAHAADPFKNTKTGLPEGEVEKAKADMLETARVQFYKQNKYLPSFSSITYMKGDTVVLRDGWTNEVMTMNVRKFIDGKRQAVFEKEQIKAMREKETFKKVSDLTLTEALNNVVDDVAEFFEYFGDSSITRVKGE